MSDIYVSRIRVSRISHPIIAILPIGSTLICIYRTIRAILDVVPAESTFAVSRVTVLVVSVPITAQVLPFWL